MAEAGGSMALADRDVNDPERWSQALTTAAFVAKKLNVAKSILH
jgi:hypothetical protein